jgi:hypothetical protein
MTNKRQKSANAIFVETCSNMFSVNSLSLTSHDLVTLEDELERVMSGEFSLLGGDPKD